MLSLLIIAFSGSGGLYLSEGFGFDFEQYTSGTVSSETIVGEVYYWSASDLSVKVSYPISQMIFLRAGDLTIVYPDQDRVIHLKDQDISILPFMQIIAGVMKEDYGLTGSGYRLKDFRTDGDTLWTFWSQPSLKRSSSFEVVFINDRVTMVELKDSDGKTVTRSVLSDHHPLRRYQIPYKIVTTHFIAEDTICRRLILHNLKSIPSPPEWIHRYSGPPGALR